MRARSGGAAAGHTPSEADATLAKIAGARKPNERAVEGKCPKCAAEARAGGKPKECKKCTAGEEMRKAREQAWSKVTREMAKTDGARPRQDDAKADTASAKKDDKKGAAGADTEKKAEASGGGGAQPDEKGWSNVREGSTNGPEEAGWWMGSTSWFNGKNTIMCDGSGSMTIHEATNYPYGQQECTRKHEQVHVQDWYARYGKDVCKNRARGDLPHGNPSGAPSYADFLKTSECSAWKVTEDCRKEKLKACGDDEDCKKYMQPQYDFAVRKRGEFCG